MTDILNEARRERDDPDSSLYASELLGGLVAEIERLRRRIAVLEQVIVEEVDVMACQDDANEIIVEMLLKQRAG